MVHYEIESTWEAFVLQCNKNKENFNNISTDIKQQPVSRRRDIKELNDDSRDDSPTRRESMQYSSINVSGSKLINIGSKKKKTASPTSVRTKLSSGGGSKKKKSSLRRSSAEWLDLSTDSSSSHTNHSSDNSLDNDIDPNELVNQLNQIYIDQLLDVSEEKQNESLNLSIEIDDNNILYLSPPSPQKQQQTAEKDDKNGTTSLLDLANDITLTPSTSFLQLDISNHDKEEMNVLECSEITLGSSFLTELVDNDMSSSNDITAVAVLDMGLSSRLDVSDNIMDGDKFEIVMNTHQMAQNTTEVADELIDTSTEEPTIADVQQLALHESTITCDEFITEALQTSFIENVTLGYNVVTNKLREGVY